MKYRKRTYTDVFLTPVFGADEVDVVNARCLRNLPVKTGHTNHIYFACINDQIANLAKKVIL